MIQYPRKAAIVLLAAGLIGALPAAANAAPCRDAHGRFTTCPASAAKPAPHRTAMVAKPAIKPAAKPAAKLAAKPAAKTAAAVKPAPAHHG